MIRPSGSYLRDACPTLASQLSRTSLDELGLVLARMLDRAREEAKVEAFKAANEMAMRFSQRD